MKLVECVPNFSEGRRPEVVNAIRDAIAAVKRVSVLDVSSDASHNRSVITFRIPRSLVSLGETDGRAARATGPFAVSVCGSFRPWPRPRPLASDRSSPPTW